MGVKGLKSFIEGTDGLMISHRLQNTYLVIDANNLMGTLFQRSHRKERRDLFGGDMVQLGRVINLFINNLRKCQVEPILVFDGGQCQDEHRDKHDEKVRRCRERMRNIMSITAGALGTAINPSITTIVLKSIALDKKVRIIQCFYEADLEIGRLANKLKCPVLSNDGDFLLMNIHSGVIPIETLDYETVRKQSEPSNNSGNNFIICHLYKQELLLKYFPDLNLDCLTILGGLCGNDFIKTSVLHEIVARVPSRGPLERFTSKGAELQSDLHIRIVKLLDFFCGKERNQLINQLCEYIPKDERKQVKEIIKGSISAYELTEEDDYQINLERIYRKGFELTYKNLLHNSFIFENQFKATMERTSSWLKRSMECSQNQRRSLEVILKKPVFIRPQIEDFSQSCAINVLIRVLRVLLALFRRSSQDGIPISFYTRVRKSYQESKITPLPSLEKFGPLNLIFYDLPNITPETSRKILLASFHCSEESFSDDVITYFEWFEDDHATEILVIKMLTNYINIEAKTKPTGNLWKMFKHSVILTIVYHFYRLKSDSRFILMLDESNKTTEMEKFIEKVDQLNLVRQPIFSKKRLYNVKIVHQITQLQVSIIGFCILNAVLGDNLPSPKVEAWFNSALIYNLVDHLIDPTNPLKLPDLPNILYQPFVG